MYFDWGIDMTSLERAIENALRLNEARNDDMFGETKPGRTYEDLKWIAAPTTAPVDRRTGQPAGEPWTMNEIWSAIRPIVVHRARKLAGGGFSKSGEVDQGVFQDLVQNAALGVVQAINTGKDEGRIGNSFQTWIDNIIRSSMQVGKSAASYFRPARGALGILEAVRDAAGAEAALDHLATKLEATGPYKDQIANLATALRDAYASGNTAAIKKMKTDMKKLREAISEAEESDRTQGAFTGLHDTISVRGRQEAHNKFRQEHGVTKAFTTTNSEGESMEAPDTPFEKSHVGGMATREAARRVLEIALNGYTDSSGVSHPPLNQRDFRILIRLFGLSDYPGAGGTKDYEFDMNKYNEAITALEAGQPVSIQPMNTKELDMLANYINADEETRNQMYDAFSEYHSAKESNQDPGDPVVIKVRSSDPDAQDEIAYMNAMSPWARSGRPQLGPKAIKADLGFDFSDVRLNTLINGIMKGVKARPSKPGKPGWAAELGRKLGHKIVGDVPEAAMAESVWKDIVLNVLVEFNGLFHKIYADLLTEQQEFDACRPFHQRLLRESQRIIESLNG